MDVVSRDLRDAVGVGGARASSEEMRLALTRFASDSSIRHMPSRRLICITAGIWNMRSSRMRFATAGFTCRISAASTRPVPSTDGTSCWQTMVRSTLASTVRACSRCWIGNWSRMRWIVRSALLVCSVASTRWPVSAAVSAIEAVSRSRISPTTMTSGSSRSAARSAVEKSRVCAPTSRCEISARFDSKRTSIGSSIVTTWTARVALIVCSSAESVVDLPEPTAPVISTRPCSRRHTDCN